MKKIIIILTLITVFLLYKEVKGEEIIIPEAAIRLRVIPNSNSVADQNMKVKVKDYLEKNTYELLRNENNIEKARTLIKENIPILEENINKIFDENNYNVDYKINYGYNYFPDKEYRGVNYKEGYYESIVISIGEAKGDNWWCVLFPNLCLIDIENKEDNEYKSWVAETINKIF